MNKILIRQAKEEDINTITTLYHNKVIALAKKGLKQWEEDEVSRDSLFEEYKVNDFYLVFKEKQAVGCFVVIDYDPTYWIDDLPKQALYIHKVMVIDEVEKQGISDLILDYFKMLGKQRKMPVVKLDVREYKVKLRSFYERNDFKLVRIQDLGKGYLTCLYDYKL